MTENRKAPKLRFKGFTDAWEQRKLGEVGSVSMCRRIFKEQTSESGDIPFYKIGTFGGQADAFISEELFAEYRSKYPYPKEGDILISASGSIGRTVEFTGGNEYFQDSNIVWLSHDDRLDNTFLKYFYSVVKWAGIEGSTIKRLYNDNILHTVISMPSVAEQKKIGAFFKELDHLITLHQRKLDRLKNIKKSMLDKMFPKDGEVVPEIRFKGFTDAWEQRKLSEVLSSYTDPVEIPRTGYERLGIRSHAKGTFHNFVPAGHELQTAQMHRVAADKFIVNITFGWEHAVAVTDENDAGKLVSHRFPQFSLSEELDPKFLKFIILDEDFRHHLWLASPGGAGRNRVLNINEMLQYEIMIPNVPEQRKIARLLIDLDNLITLHQRKSQYYIRRIRKECLMI